MHLFTALGLLLAIPALIAYIQEEKDDATVRSTSVCCMVLGLWYILWPLIEQLQRWSPRRGSLDLVLAVAAAVVGLLLVLRANNKVVGTLACCGGSLLCLLALEAIRA
jgi:peptidoglycan/LPS O-acetylase OafA/YrhL